jgi:hypothetical protein
MKRLEYEENSDVGLATLLFMGIYGVGPAIAREWYQRGLRTLDDVRNRKDGIRLSAAQEVSHIDASPIVKLSLSEMAAAWAKILHGYAGLFYMLFPHNN